ncbi:hypothetical protein AAMO2058_000759600 [Amorphochlora amoebiformis]
MAVAGGMLGGLSLLVLRKSGLGGPAILSILLCVATPVSAHNWLRCPGRAFFEASSSNPFRQRKASEVHAQVGPGQKMAVKFATGHTDNHYFVAVNGAHQDFMFANDYKDNVNDYLNNVPSGMNKAALFPRTHACNKHSHCLNAEYFAGKVSTSASNYCDHPSYPAKNPIYNYKSELLVNDVLTYYHNPKYPWIVAAARYKNLVHLPNDEDIFCMEVPLKNATLGGHHIVHWFWRGYYDAIDVNAHASPVPNELIYGKRTSESRISKTDHCQYVKPRALLTPIRDATLNMTECFQDLNDVANNRNAVNEIAMNVVPLDNPDEVAISNVMNIPLNYTDDLENQNIRWPLDTLNIALESPLMKLEGNVTRGGMNWAPFVQSLTLHRNMKCIWHASPQPLESIVQLAFENPAHYVGFMWVHHNRDIKEVYGNAAGDLYLCLKGKATTPGATFHTFFFPSNLVESPASVGWPSSFSGNPFSTSYKVSFQPKNPTLNGIPFSINLEPGWKEDNGDVYSDSRGYGWRCQQEMVVEKSFPRPEPALATNRSVGRTSRLSKLCPDGNLNSWEIAVPNGAYAVTLLNYRYTGGSFYGCVAENTRMPLSNLAAKSVVVEVKDGRFTLSQTGRHVTLYAINFEKTYTCTDLFWIKLDRLATRVPRMLNAPTSGSKQAWWQTEFQSASQPVGAVTIELPSVMYMSFASVPSAAQRYYVNCMNRWFYEPGASCMKSSYVSIRGNGLYRNEVDDPDIFRKASAGERVPSMRKNHLAYQQPWGKYNISNPNVGAVVSISDLPCTEDGGCPKTNEKICRVIAETGYFRDSQIHQHESLVKVDCKGQTGKYLRVYLRGQNRVLMIRRVNIHRPVVVPSQLATPAPNHRKSLCYGLRPRVASLTQPSFITTEDPTDPIFYSTCYTRSWKTEWLPLPKLTPPEPRKFIFNGECLSCTSFLETDPSTAISQNKTLNWYFSTDTCQSCTNELSPWGEGKIPSKATSHPTSSPSKFPSATPTAGPSEMTSHPTSSPSKFPSATPTAGPSEMTSHPTSSPSKFPSATPTARPSAGPSAAPFVPTASPFGTNYPSSALSSYGFKVGMILNLALCDVTPAWIASFKDKVCSLIAAPTGCVETSFEAGSVKATLKFTKSTHSGNQLQAQKFIDITVSSKARVESELKASIIFIDLAPTFFHSGLGSTFSIRQIEDSQDPVKDSHDRDDTYFFIILAALVCTITFIGGLASQRCNRKPEPVQTHANQPQNCPEELHQMDIGTQ